MELTKHNISEAVSTIITRPIKVESINILVHKHQLASDTSNKATYPVILNID